MNRPAEGAEPSNKKHPGGRPSKLTPDIERKALTAIRSGSSIEAACAVAGIDRTTLYKWTEQARQGKGGRYKEFFNNLTRARDEGEVHNLALLNQQARGMKNIVPRLDEYGKPMMDPEGKPLMVERDIDARTLTWLLAVMNPTRYSQRSRLDLGVSKGAEEDLERQSKFIAELERNDEAFEAVCLLSGILIDAPIPGTVRKDSLER